MLVQLNVACCIGFHSVILCMYMCVCSEYLNQNADMFQRTATRLKRKLWWQNVKLWIILIVIILVILAVIISEYPYHPNGGL